MAKPEWGEKHRCVHCGTVFYDMLRKPIICPGCDKVHHPESLLKSRRSRADEKAAERAAAAKAEAAVKADKTDTEEEGADDDNGDLLEDASELAEDDDISDVAPGLTDDDKD